MHEALITVDGVTLNHAQSMTVRVALASFNTDLAENGLGDDDHGKFMTKSYRERCVEVEELIFSSIQSQSS